MCTVNYTKKSRAYIIARRKPGSTKAQVALGNYTVKK